MINRTSNPLGWSLLLSDLDDAREHLDALLREIQASPEYGEPEFRVDLGHVYAHLNRAWRRRNVSEDFTDAEWGPAGQFPEDLEPVA